MKKINEIVTFSGAIELMCKGLKKQDKNELFEIDMRTFGEYGKSFFLNTDGNFCLRVAISGCGATAAIMEIANKQLTPGTIDTRKGRAKALGFEFKDLENFEFSLDDFGLGKPQNLLKYFQITAISKELNNELKKLLPYRLHEGTWRERLHYYQAFAATAKKLGY